MKLIINNVHKFLSLGMIHKLSDNFLYLIFWFMCPHQHFFRQVFKEMEKIEGTKKVMGRPKQVI